jgi:hypothetical protein
LTLTALIAALRDGSVRLRLPPGDPASQLAWLYERVEAIGPDGEVYVAQFSGPSALERAAEYAGWKNQA